MLAFPKTDTPKERRRRVRIRRKSRSMFRSQVLNADGFRCANRKCTSVNRDKVQLLEAHHLIKLSHGGPDHIRNGMALCPTCHHYAHNGYNTDEGRVTGRQFEIQIIKQYRSHRWGDALAHMESMEAES
jgi:5-methylcytosine-specific restriction endonuclease McrA